MLASPTRATSSAERQTLPISSCLGRWVSEAIQTGPTVGRALSLLSFARETVKPEIPKPESDSLPCMPMVMSEICKPKVNLLPKEIEVVRIDEIAGMDLQADGGTHAP